MDFEDLPKEVRESILRGLADAKEGNLRPFDFHLDEDTVWLGSGEEEE